MKQRITTGVLFTLGVALFVIPGYWHPLPPLIFFFSVSLLAARELIRAVRVKGLQPNPVLASSGSLLMFLPLVGAAGYSSRNNHSGNPFDGFSDRLVWGFAFTAFALLLAMAFGVIGILIKRGPNALPDAVATVMILAYVAFPLSCPILLLIEVKGGWIWLLIGLAAPWISDSFAYFTGSLLGRRKILPAISPRKTLEGCLGGIVGSMLILPLIFSLFGRMLGQSGPLSWGRLIFALASGLVLSVASQLGDWLASGIKRWCGIKDFGSFLPGHGGILDRFDSAFFTLPMVLAIAVLYQMLLI